MLSQGEGKRKLSMTWLAVIIVVAVLLLSMIGTALTRTNFCTVKEIRFTGTLKEVADMIKANNEETQRDVDILFTADETAQFNMTTYIPKNATKENPAPVIVGAHGWNNTQEMQMANIVELTRRGFIVVVFDLGGHGRTDVAINDLTQNASKQNTEGAVVAVEYAMSLPEADVERVGVTGHSAGDLALAYTVNWLNGNKADGTPYSKHHIAAFFCPTGTISAMFVSSSTPLILGIASGKADELDTFYFGTADFMGDPSQFNPTFGFVNPSFLVMTKAPYPGIMGQQVKEGVFYNKNGEMPTPETGKALDFGSDPRNAVAIWNPKQTHVQGTWSLSAAALNIDFFYAAFGTPTNAKVLASSNQVWGFAVFFQLIGLLGFFASAFVFGAALLEVPYFKGLRKEPTLQEDLPSIKSWKEIVPLVLTFLPLFLLPQLYFKCFAAAERVLNPDVFSIPNGNGPAYFTLICGIITFAMLGVNYIVKRLCHIKDKEPVLSTMAPAKVEGGLAQFGKTLLYVISVVVLMYIPCIIGYYVFNMSFGISVYTVGVPRLIWLPTIVFKYLPFWIVFMVANAIINNLARFKEIPEWASTAFCTVANVLPIIIMIIINYVTLSKTGLTKYTFGDPTIMSWNLIAPMIFIGISGRYFYKKTGNSWAGALINALIVCLMAVSITRHTSDVLFAF